MRIKNNVLSVLMTISILTSPLLFAADHQDLSYQGLLTDAGGDPVADGDYDIVFSIWDDSTGGSQLWSQVRPVQTNSGMFNTMLQNPFGFLFELGVPAPDGPFFLQLQVGADPPVTPRISFGTTYGSTLTQRVEGDIYTSPGQIQILPAGVAPRGVNPQVSQPGINLKTDENENVISVGSVLDTFPAMVIRANSIGADLFAPFGETYLPQDAFLYSFRLSADGVRNAMELSWPQSPEDTIPDIILKTDENENVISVGSVLDTFPAIVIRADSSGSSITANQAPPNFTRRSYGLFSNGFQSALELDWTRSPEDTIPDITLKTDDDENVISVWSVLDSLPAFVIRADSIEHMSQLYQHPESFGSDIGHGPFSHRFSANAFRNSFEMDWHRSAEDTIPDITLKTDDNENVISIGSVLDTFPAMVIRADASEHSFQWNTLPNAAAPGTAGDRAFKLSTNSARTQLELDWPSSTEDTLPDITLEAKDDENVISLWSPTDSFAMIQVSTLAYENSYQALTNLYYDLIQDEDPPYCVYVGASEVQNALKIHWFPPPAGEPSAATLAVDSIRSFLDLRFHDGAGTSDLPQINLTSTAVSSSFTMLGPDPGAAGGPKTIVMTADASEARIGINTASPTSALYVTGDIVATGSITELSDRRLKENVTEIENAIEIIGQIRGVQFEWRQDQNEFTDLPEGKRVGLIAQEIEKILPEAVLSPVDGYKSVDYSRLTPVLVQAIKEQQKQIDELKEMVSQLSNGSREQIDR